MTILSPTEARAKLYSHIGEAANSHHPIVIREKRGNSVLISEEDWNAISETGGPFAAASRSHSGGRSFVGPGCWCGSGGYFAPGISWYRCEWFWWNRCACSTLPDSGFEGRVEQAQRFHRSQRNEDRKLIYSGRGIPALAFRLSRTSLRVRQAKGSRVST